MDEVRSLEEAIKHAQAQGFNYIWGFGPSIKSLADDKTTEYLKSQGGDNWVVCKDRSLLKALNVTADGRRYTIVDFQMFKGEPTKQVFSVEMTVLTEPGFEVTGGLIETMIQYGWQEGRSGHITTEGGGGIDSLPFDCSELKDLRVTCGGHNDKGSFMVDLPRLDDLWDEVGVFDTWDEALEFCKANFNTDSLGRVGLISQLNDEEA